MDRRACQASDSCPWSGKELDLTQHTCTLTHMFAELGLDSNGNKEWKCSLEENTTEVSFL